MILAFLEDGTLSIYGTLLAVQRDFEGLDVESGAVLFYDDEGRPLEPRFRTPNRHGKLLGLIPWVSSGHYDLVPNPAAQVDSLALALYETRSLSPNPWFASLEQLKAQLRARGVAVDFERPAGG